MRPGLSVSAGPAGHIFDFRGLGSTPAAAAEKQARTGGESRKMTGLRGESRQPADSEAQTKQEAKSRFRVKSGH